MNYLGLDYGTKHIGVAIATGPLAEPLTTLPAKTAVQLIKQLVNRHSIDAIVIGEPDARIKKSFESFVNYLKIENCELKIIDETLSSHDTRQSLLHTTQRRRRQKEHAVSAALILQSWLDSHHQSG